MARIRTVKPDLFRHEGLQDLEINHPGMCCILVFIALFGHCDANGVFPWQPRQLKLDILPFLDFEMAGTLNLLLSAGFVRRYEVSGKTYGLIPTFKTHQRLSGKEVSSGEKYPLPPEGSTWEAPGNHQGNNGEIPESQELGIRNEELGKESLPPEALRLSGMLADKILENNPENRELSEGKRDRTIQAWAGDIEKMHRIDGRSWETIERIVEWCQSDTFWKGNILSGKKLRDKADQLLAKMPSAPTMVSPTDPNRPSWKTGIFAGVI